MMHLVLVVEMFKVRMQGQYGAATDKRLSVVAREMWQQWGFRKGVMRGYWVTVTREIPAYAGYVPSLFLQALPPFLWVPITSSFVSTFLDTHSFASTPSHLMLALQFSNPRFAQFTNPPPFWFCFEVIR
jgi:hypothetical protein